MRKLYLFAAMAAMLAACSSDDLTKDTAVQQNADDGAVMFSAYMQRVTTRAGLADVMNLENLKKSQEEGGCFGVFGYYTNNATYDQQAIPNFFYNEKIWWESGYFTYAPIKYWPNEYGKTAQSEDNDKVTFFAYAPYVEVSPSTGKVIKTVKVGDEEKIDQEESAKLQKWGITTLSNNSATGDPLVKYLVSFDQDKSVDLCWGVCEGTDTQWNIVETGSGALQTLNSGYPWIDVQRPAEAKTQASANQRVKFTFKHATAQLMVKINAFVDGTDNTNSIAENTKVYVRSVTFEGFATKGALNLNNTETGANKAYWMDWTGSNDIVTGESVTIYDGRKDGKEGTPSGEATNEKTLGLNPALVQSDGWTSSAKGVTKDLQNLFRKWDPTAGTEGAYVAADKPIYVIPTGDNVRVTITYDIETKDDKLSTYVSDVTTHGSSIENVISKDINFGSSDLTALENGKSYVINLHLGMNSVKFDAAVSDWVEAETTPDVDVPANVPQFEAKPNGSTEKNTVELPATATSYTFAITGLNGGEAITAPDDNGSFTKATANAANSSGVAIESISIAPNMTPNDKDAVDMTWTGMSSTKVAKMSFVQKAHALGLKVMSVDDKIITLDAEATGIDWTNDINASTLTNGDNDAIKVWRNGSRLLFVETGVVDGKFTYANTPNKIQLPKPPVPGETYTIYVKAGNAEGETVTFHVGGTVLPAPATTPVPIEYGDTYQITPIFYGAKGVEPGWTWESTSGTYISVNGDGMVSTIKVTDNPQTVTLSTSAKTAGNGWVYDTSVRTYQVTVAQATASISFKDNAPTSKSLAYSPGTEIITNPVILKNSNGNELEAGPDAGGAVSYAFDYAKNTASNVDISGRLLIDQTSGKISITSPGLGSNSTYEIKVKATVTSNDNAVYGTANVVSYTITFTTGS